MSEGWLKRFNEQDKSKVAPTASAAHPSGKASTQAPPHTESYSDHHNANRSETPAMPGGARMLPTGRLTYNDAAKHIFGALKTANDNKPILVTPVDKSGSPMSHHARAASTQRHLATMTRMAASGHYGSGHTINHSTETRIGEMHVHPQTGDGQRFAGEFRQDMMRRGDVVQSNGALV